MCNNKECNDYAHHLTKVAEETEDYISHLIHERGINHLLDLTQPALLTLCRVLYFLDACIKEGGIDSCVENPVSNSAFHCIETFVNSEAAHSYLINVLPQYSHIYALLRSNAWRNREKEADAWRNRDNEHEA